MPERETATVSDIAAALVDHLRHLRDFRGIAYMPASLCAVESGPSARNVPNDSPALDGAVAHADRQGPRIDRKDALREQARSWTSATKLEYLRRHNVGDCRRCRLWQGRASIVFGVGNPDARLMFIGEAPGADEDRQGEPFVGRAGQRLTEWIRAIGLTRESVYIANVLKCRPPGNRDPLSDEVDACSPFLHAQIRAIGPAVIVALGRHAGMLLARRDTLTLAAMRASRLEYKDPTGLSIPLIVTYHPAYVLRRERDGEHSRGPSVNDTVLSDLRRALAVIEGRGG